MTKPALTAALFSAAFFYACPVFAQTVAIGQPCNNSPYLEMKRSEVATEGDIQCIPNGQGQFYWQPKGAGIPLYDTTATCAIPGQLRWNGSAVQYCNGTTWNALGGGPVGKLYWDGNWGGNSYWCDSGYHIVMFHYDCGCSNNTTWFECQAN